MAWETDLALEFKKRNNNKTLGAVVGKVTSTSPLLISILSGQVILDKSKMFVCERLLEHSDSGNINLNSVPTHGSVSTSFTSTINPRLQVGNLVLCLPDDSGQKFFIVDKVV